MGGGGFVMCRGKKGGCKNLACPLPILFGPRASLLVLVRIKQAKHQIRRSVDGF